MDWTPFLATGEVIIWQGRPAPRCFTFRHWKKAAFGLFLLLVCVGWLLIGMQLAGEYQNPWPGLLPIPFVVIGCNLAFGPLLLARLEWENVYLALTDRRLITLRGVRRQRLVGLDRQDILYFRMNRLGEQLGTLQVHGKAGDPVLFLHCVEYPLQLTGLLEKIVEQNLETAKADGTLAKHH